MKYHITLAVLLIYSLSMAQGDISLSIAVSADTIYMDNAFRLQYSVKNGSADGFQNPTFKDFQLIQGPSRSSQISIINGVQSSEESFTYYFKPNQEGVFNVDPFELEIEGQTYTSNSPVLIIVSNPDKLHQDPNSGQVEGKPLPVKNSNTRKRFKI